MPEQYMIRGQVIPSENLERAGLRVRVIDHDLPSLEQRPDYQPRQLGEEAVTNSDGFFEITYTGEQFQHGEGIRRGGRQKQPDIRFHVYNRGGQALTIREIQTRLGTFGPEEILYNVPALLEEVQIVVGDAQPAGDSEFERLTAAVAPVIASMPLASLTDSDLAFLNRELADVLQEMGPHLHWLHSSAILAQDTLLPIEAFYGWGRLGVPAPCDELAQIRPPDLPAVLERLLSLPTDQLLETLMNAAAERIIPAGIRERLSEIAEEIENLRAGRGLVTARRFTGKLLSEVSGEPLTGREVQGFDLDAGAEPKDLGQAVTGSDGLFALRYNVPRAEGEPEERRLRLVITLDAQAESQYATEISAGADPAIVEVRVPLPEAEEPPDHQLDQLVEKLQINLPQELRAFLSDQHIHSLAGLRRVGSLSRIEGLPIPADDPCIRLLEAHADLSRLSPDVEANAQMIEKHYDSVQAIASTPRSSFVMEIAEKVGDFNAAELHVAATAQTHLLNNIVTSLVVERANGFHVNGAAANNGEENGSTAFDTAAPEAIHPEHCGCSDCEAAVSPLAYLADLLRYTMQHVKDSSGAVTPDTLTNTFYQPFGALTADCGAVDAQVRQVRLAIEMLRGYLKDHPPAASQQAALEQAESSYRLTAYTLLLQKLGASYDALRLSLTAEPRDRQAMADRLGIAEAHLNDLAIDPAALTEALLEQRFGLLDTTRDPLAASSTPAVQTWRLEYQRALWKALDGSSGAPPGTPPMIDPDLIGPADFANPTAGDPAFDLWLARTASTAAQHALLAAAPQTQAGLDDILSQALGVPLTDFLKIEKAQKQGDSITADLDRLHLSAEAFGYLLRVRALAVQGQPILAEEWENGYAILIQSWKRQNAASWRDEERAAGIVLSSEFFRIAPPPPAIYPPAPLTAIEHWRAPRADRQDWQDNLQTRLNQEQNIIQALNEAISSAEEAALPMLRDALVLATGAEGDDLATKAEWITQNLLMDARMDGCALTTRVSQAMETLQSLLSALRAEQVRPVFQSFALNADHFDAEWKWLGSYATWRSAMFVFLYPENLTNPNLRHRMTPAFRTLLQNTQSPRRVTPGMACREAQQYAEYFRDIATLRVEATCTSRTHLFQADACLPELGYRCLFYMFGRGGLTGKVYWSAYDMQDVSGYAQTFWQPVQIDGFDHISEVFGAVPYQVSPEERYIYLFAKRLGSQGEQIVYIRYHLEKAAWNTDVIPLAMPGPFKAVVRQDDSESSPPQIAVTIPAFNGRMLHELMIRPDGTGWEDGGFHSLIFYGEVMGMLGSPNDFYLIYENTSLYCTRFVRTQVTSASHPTSRYSMAASTVFGEWSGVSLSILPTVGKYQGAFTWPGRNHFYIVTAQMKKSGGGPLNLITLPRATVWRVSDNGTQTLQRKAVKSPFGFSEPRILPTGGVVEDATSKTKRLVYQEEGRPAWMDSFLIYNDVGDVHAHQPLTIMPTVAGPFDIPSKLSPQDLQLRKGLIQKVFAANQAGPASNLVYLQEAYYFAAVHLALSLQRSGAYVEALDWFRTVYDYTAQQAERKIYYGLTAEESLAEVYKRGKDWLMDPLNPHAIAAARRNTYTRYTLQAITRCLLDYADAQFTLDTAESNPLARRHYLIALELLDTADLKQSPGTCEAVIATVDELALGPEWTANVQQLKLDLQAIPSPAALKETAAQVQAAFALEGTAEQRFANARAVVSQAVQAVSTPTLQTLLEREGKATTLVQQTILQNADVEQAVQSAGQAAAIDFQRRVTLVTGKSVGQLARSRGELPWLQQAVTHSNGQGNSAAAGAVTRPDAARLDLLAPAHISSLAEVAASQPMTALNASGGSQSSFIPAVVSTFCVPPNPVLKALRLRAELNLFKLRTCRNIAGMKRALDAYAAATDTTSGMPVIGAGGQLSVPGANAIRPSLYQERVLRDRAKELVQIAAQMESAMLAALEKGAAERYSMLKAHQELGLAQAGVRLQSLRVTRSEHGVKLAELQQQRAEIQVTTFSEWIEKGLNQYELELLGAYEETVALQGEIAMLEATAQMLQAQTTAATASFGAAAAGAMAFAVGVTAGFRAERASQLARVQSNIQKASFNASYERRKDEWLLQQSLAQQDVKIGEEGITLALDEVEISQQEKTIAEMGVTQARDVIEFLNNKFSTAALYESMSATLEQAYSFFLQYATAAAKVYENQVAFLRQETPLGIIKNDYWAVPGDDGANAATADRKGITGAARLMQDLYQLDQYAFESRKRKLHITKTISLASFAPVEFQRFRETGVMVFSTPMEIFDRDFPGHYLRTISRVRTSVVALVPAVDGIHATLSNSGLSRVVIGPDIFQTVPIRREPEFVALSTPINATGVLEMEVQQSDMLYPFEGSGVDTSWELRLPKAANHFDFHTIADVLITMEYLALNSYEYQQQVTQQMKRTLQSDRAFSFRNHFPDAWYDLHNPELVEESQQMIVGVKIDRSDFPANLENIRMQHVMLYFARADGLNKEVRVDHLKLTRLDGSEAAGGAVTTLDGTISTRRANGSPWLPLTTAAAGSEGPEPFGVWELSLRSPDAGEMQQLRDWLDQDLIEDILLVVSYSGRTPEWPG